MCTYSNSGQLSCIVCKLNIKDDALWSDHIKSKVHKENITKRKPESSKVTERLGEPIESLKRTFPVHENPTPPKKIKGILKNAKPKQDSNIPSDFFESPSKKTLKIIEPNVEKMEEETVDNDELNIDKGELPKGFFDDPMLDAKVRKEEYVSSIDEEFIKFQKEMKEENLLSEQIMADNEDEATYGRQVEEIDEQIKHWSKVIELEKKRDQIAQVTENLDNIEIKNDSIEEEESDDSDFDEFIDWRSKS